MTEPALPDQEQLTRTEALARLRQRIERLALIIEDTATKVCDVMQEVKTKAKDPAK